MKKMSRSAILGLAIAIGASTSVALDDFAVGAGIGAAAFIAFGGLGRTRC